MYPQILDPNYLLLLRRRHTKNCTTNWIYGTRRPVINQAVPITTTITLVVFPFVRCHPMRITTIYLTKTMFRICFTNNSGSALHPHSTSSIFKIAQGHPIKRSCVLFINVRTSCKIMGHCQSRYPCRKIGIHFFQCFHGIRPYLFVSFKFIQSFACSV